LTNNFAGDSQQQKNDMSGGYWYFTIFLLYYGIYLLLRCTGIGEPAIPLPSKVWCVKKERHTPSVRVYFVFPSVLLHQRLAGCKCIWLIESSFHWSAEALFEKRLS